MSRKNSWLDYIDPVRMQGNSFGQLSWMMDEAVSFIKKLFNGSVKKTKQPIQKTVRKQTSTETGQQDDTASVSPELTVVRQGSGAFSRGSVLPGTEGMPEISGRISSPGKDSGSDRQAALRNAVLWSEILGEPAAKKRQRKRVSQYYGNQSNADRG